MAHIYIYNQIRIECLDDAVNDIDKLNRLVIKPSVCVPSQLQELFGGGAIRYNARGKELDLRHSSTR